MTSVEQEPADRHGVRTAAPESGSAPEHSRNGRNVLTPGVCAVLGVAGAVLYVSFLVQGPFGVLDATSSFVSELSARDQPWHMLFQLTDISSGALIAALGLGVRRAAPPGLLLRPGTAALVLFGFATTAVGLLPLDCAPTANRSCQFAEALGRVSVLHHGHTVASVVGSVAVIVSLGLLGRHLRREPGWRIAGWVGLVSLPVVTMLCGLLAVLAVLGVDLGPGAQPLRPVALLLPYLGVYERVELTLCAVWIAVLSVSMLATRRHRTNDEHTCG
jgi:hypothetical protein